MGAIRGVFRGEIGRDQVCSGADMLHPGIVDDDVAGSIFLSGYVGPSTVRVHFGFLTERASHRLILAVSRSGRRIVRRGAEQADGDDAAERDVPCPAGFSVFCLMDVPEYAKIFQASFPSPARIAL